MSHETDTPRTDAVVSEPCAIHQVMQKWEKIIENSRQLERELNELWSRFDKQMEAEAEVERLKKLLQEARPVLRHTAMYCFDAVNCICGTEYLEERIDEALNPTDK